MYAFSFSNSLGKVGVKPLGAVQGVAGHTNLFGQTFLLLSLV